MRGNPYVEVVHWLQSNPGSSQDSDLHRIVRHYDLDIGAISSPRLTRALDALPRGASSAISDLSEHLMDVTERGWVYGLAAVFNTRPGPERATC